MLTPEYEAVTDTCDFLLTLLVEIAKVALVAPAGIVTLDGTVATLEFELDRLTVTPPVPAAADSFTVPVDEPPPVTDVGLTATELNVVAGTGFAVSDAVLLTRE